MPHTISNAAARRREREIEEFRARAARFAGTTHRERQTAGYTSLADFALDVMRRAHPGRRPSDRLQHCALSSLPGPVYAAAPTSVHTAGAQPEGYEVPPAFRDAIWDRVFEGDTNVLALIAPEPTSKPANAATLVTDESTPWGATGLSAAWRPELTELSPSKLVTGARSVPLHPLYVFLEADEDLVEDVPLLNARLETKAPEVIRYKAVEALMNGTGVGQPLGWRTSDAIVTQAAEVTSPAQGATVLPANVLKMFSRLILTDPSRAAWLCHSTVLPQLGVMDRPVYDGKQMLGLPVIPTQHNPALGNLGDIQVVDFSGYYAVTPQVGIKFARSIHLWFDYNVEAFRFTFRIGGQPFASAPVTSADGSTTRSHFVQLAART